MRILLIEDDETNSRVLQALLTKAIQGPVTFDVRRADRIYEALQILDGEPEFDVILLDLGLPECSGLTSLKLILSHTRSVPVVVVTGTESPEVKEAAIEAGAKDFLIKGRFGAPRIEQAILSAAEGQRSLPEGPGSPQIRGEFLGTTPA